ncbi:MAG: hypothetical protein KAR40_15465 [Candidatus Sabulitectum sp.]|nr:hypothetical protein [Candidatus Sabulitectum sp.]
METKAQQIRAVLVSLDPTNDDLWLASGLPRMEAVESRLGDRTITRQDVSTASTDFNRDSAFAIADASAEDEALLAEHNAKGPDAAAEGLPLPAPVEVKERPSVVNPETEAGLVLADEVIKDSPVGEEAPYRADAEGGDNHITPGHPRGSMPGSCPACERYMYATAISKDHARDRVQFGKVVGDVIHAAHALDKRDLNNFHRGGKPRARQVAAMMVRMGLTTSPLDVYTVQSMLRRVGYAGLRSYGPILTPVAFGRSLVIPDAGPESYRVVYMSTDPETISGSEWAAISLEQRLYRVEKLMAITGADYRPELDAS